MRVPRQVAPLVGHASNLFADAEGGVLGHLREDFGADLVEWVDGHGGNDVAVDRAGVDAVHEELAHG